MNTLSQGRSRQVQTESFASRQSSNRGRAGRRRSEAVRPAPSHGFHAEEKNGATPRSFAPDAYDCIMVTVRTDRRIQGCGGARLLRPKASSLRSCVSLSTGCRCLILGDRSAPACGQTRTDHPTNLKELVIQPGNELESTAPLQRGGGPRRRPLGCRDPDHGAPSRALVASRRPEGPPLTARAPWSGKRVSPRGRRRDLSSARNGSSTRVRRWSSNRPP